MPSYINKKYEAQHLADIKREQLRVDALYIKTIDKIFKEAAHLKPKGNIFSIDQYPEFSKKVDKILLEFNKDVNITLVNGIKGQWELAIDKNANIIHKLYDKDKIVDQVNRMIYDPQSAALEEFTNRKIAGLGISDRVFKYTNQFRAEIEQGLYVGVNDGTPAARMARDQKQYLQQPDKLFRRVQHINRRGENVLKLSKSAQSYKPGKGVYRSAYKNAMRLTRDTVNDAYRQSDMVRYQTLPFILSYSVNLSNNHPRTDICDDLKGTYPKTFVWLKWHNQCLCNCTSNLASPADFDRYQNAILNGTDKDFKFTGVVTSVPNNFTDYVTKNTGMMDNWKRKPDWVLTNDVKI